MKNKLLRTIILRFLINQNNKKIIVAGTGRMGTSLLCNAIGESLRKKNFFINLAFNLKLTKNYPIDFIKNFEDIRNSKTNLIKTHDLINSSNLNIINNSLFIFVYGNPLHSLYSVNKILMDGKIDWVKDHLSNLKTNKIEIKRLGLYDSLNYENQIKCYLRFINHENFFFINYNDLWKKKKSIEEFISLKLNYPSFKKRKIIKCFYTKKIYKKLYNLYYDFNKKIKDKYD